MKKLVLINLLIALIAITGCKAKKEVELDPSGLGSDKAIYERAQKLGRKDAEKSRLLYKEILQVYPDSVYARKAKIGIADSYFKQRDSSSLIIAASEYQEFVNLYPNSPDSIYAKFRIGKCYERRSKSAGRDQTNTKQAITAYESLQKMFPGTEESDKADVILKKLKQRLGQHYFGIGMANFRLKAFKGTIDRFKQVIDNYPDFTKFDKLYYFTGKSYAMMKDYDSAMSFYQKIINSFPKSKYVNGSKKSIAKLMKEKERAPKKEEKIEEKEEDKKEEN
ncbi:MAG: outer membrane protein assembly factor BamD [Candidatus Aminicenantes bacterium]|nr:outer membrane protein assembly factor BamD [Candidatus Aminicenantes bacterium]